MIRRKGIAGLVGNSLYWIKGIFTPSYSVTSITIAPPNLTIGLASIIQSAGKGALSGIIANGQSSLSLINTTEGLSSIIQLNGRGVSSAITETGQGVDSK